VNLPGITDVRVAAGRIQPWLHRTPVLTSRSLDELTGVACWFKCENWQKSGAFKARGATNAIFHLTEAEAAKGVATHSSGNHGAALALAAGWRGIKARVVMPRTAPTVKLKAVAAYGGEIILCEPTQESRQETLAAVLRETGAVYIPPYNHFEVIAGQGTASLELLEEVPGLDVVMAPVGGGGLLSGTAVTVSALAPGIQIWGSEPAQADDAARSLQAGKLILGNNPQTIADGLRTSLGELTYAIISQRVSRILTVSEDEIVQAMQLIWERLKIVVELSGAVPFAAVLAHAQELQGKRVGLILSGGNVDLDRLPWMRS
jgi:threonine dehydratase